MKDISIYFKPREIKFHFEEERLGNKIIFHSENGFPEIEKNGIALIECPEYRNDVYQETEHRSMDDLLFPFYQLYTGELWNFNIYDLGILLPGNSIKDTYFALSQVISELIKRKIIPIIIGGSQDLTFPMYQAYKTLEQMVNLTIVDNAFDLGDPEGEIKSNAFITPILLSRPCFLFNCSTIGIQAPYIKKSELDLFERLYFDVCRLGEYNSDFKIVEPILRNTDIASIDMNAIRFSDFKSQNNNPNGFYADQICQIAKYAGISDKLTSFGLFNSLNEFRFQNKQLVAEIIWYFIDGYAQRKGDFPIGSKKDYTKFIVHLEDENEDLVFYKSPKSDRWWLEVPYPTSKGTKYERHHLIPCTYEDYQAAMLNEIPDLWWKTFQKLTVQ
jgi:formiminoglutamase